MGYRIANGEALLQQTWDAALNEESQENDIMTDMTGTYSDSTRKIPDAAIMRVMMKPGANSHTLGLLMDLTGAGRQGAGVALTGFTESMDTRKQTVYANDVRHGVNIDNFGLYAFRNEPYKLMEEVNGLLSKWLKGRRGKHMRQAMLEKVSDNLETSPTSLTAGWNKNIIVKNVADGSQPTYDSTLADYTSNLNTALSSAGTTSAANLDISFFTHLEYYVTTQWKLKPMEDGTYICTVPARQARYLKVLDGTESISGLMRTTLSTKVAEQAWAQTLPQIGKLRLLVDDRAPIINRNSATGVLTAAYRDVGSTDERSSYTNTGNNTVWDVGMVFGKGAIIEAIMMKPRYDEDLTDIGRLKDVGMSTTYGFQVNEYDDDTATDSTRKAQSGGVYLSYSGTATA